jgi:large subunit ribosomal protein L31
MRIKEISVQGVLCALCGKCFSTAKITRRSRTMKQGIHPDYKLSAVHCACGEAYETRSTKPSIRLDICSVCHPFFTGKQKLIDTEGRIEKFRKKYTKA